MLSVATQSALAMVATPPMAQHSRVGTVRMGFTPSPKEIDPDPAIPDVLKIVKVDQAARFARANMNGAAFAATLPGVGAPFGYFDPFNLADTVKDQGEILMWREAELAHCRVSMMVRCHHTTTEAPPANQHLV